MLNEAQAVARTGSSDEALNPDDEVIMVWEGMFTQLITSKLNLSVPYYSKIRGALINMGCVRQLRRGGGGSPSQYELVYEPTLEAFLKADQTAPKAPAQTKDAATAQNILALNNRVSELEAWRDSVNEMLAETLGTETVS
jgi:hypothetical protein